MKLFLLALLTILISCGKSQKVIVEKPDYKKDFDAINLFLESLQIALNNRIDALEARIYVLESQDLERRVSELENSQEDQDYDILALKSQVNLNTQAINNLTSQTSLIVSQIQTIQSQISDLNNSQQLQDSEISKLKAQILELTDELSLANLEINNLKNSVDENTSQILTINSQLATIQIKLADLQAQINSNKVEIVSPCGKEVLQKIGGKFYSVMVESATTNVSFSNLVPNHSPIKVQYCDGLLGLNALGIQVCLGSVKFKEIVNLDVSQGVQTVPVTMVTKVYLGQLAENTLYSTTDGQTCNFKIVNGNVVRQ